MKPNDVSQEAWDAAIEAYGSTIADFSGFRGSPLHIAYAIEAAKAEEREACAKLAMSFVEKLDKVGEEQEWMERYDACIKIAMAIRSRT